MAKSKAAVARPAESVSTSTTDPPSSRGPRTLRRPVFTEGEKPLNCLRTVEPATMTASAFEAEKVLTG